MATDALSRIRSEEAAVEAMEAASARLRRVAAEAMGTGGGAPVRLRDGFASSQGGWRLVIGLGAFVAVDQALTVALSVLGPDVSGSLGLSKGEYDLMVSLRPLLALVVAWFVAWCLHRRESRRRAFAVGAAVLAGLAVVAAALSASGGSLLLALALSAATAGVVWPVHRPMVIDGYRPEVRVRAMCVYQAGIVVAAVAAPVAVAVLLGPVGLSWRGLLLVVGAGGMAVAMAGVGLAHARSGRHDTEVARAALRLELGAGPDGSGAGQGGELTFGETLRRLWLIPTVSRLLAVCAVIGVLLTKLFTYVSFYLQDKWAMSASERSLFVAAAWAAAFPALAWFAPRGDAWFRSAPSRLLSASAWSLVLVAGGLLVTWVAPIVGVALVGLGVVLAGTTVLVPAVTVVLFSMVPASTRSHAGALVVTFFTAVGGVGGGALLAGLDRRFGPGVAIGLLAIPALVAGWLMRGAARSVGDDVEQVVERLVEEEELRALSAAGERLPMVACRHIDFSYGQLQVLFDVNFTVDDGEMVALLGTNGAGKSTLLKCISGIGLPSSGSVRFRGSDVTFLDAERRVSLGIAQVPGGRAVFGPMTVAENLRLFGYTLARDRKKLDQAIERCFEVFPRLAERRNQNAVTLSGGEQQMLGLSKALILEPRLLLIDELSLGLAPVIVGQLLEMVRQINAQGAAVVLVEQSVNIALSLVDHAYFMEKGEMRFDGRSQDLLARGDLLRAVFLEGATNGAGRV